MGRRVNATCQWLNGDTLPKAGLSIPFHSNLNQLAIKLKLTCHKGINALAPACQPTAHSFDTNLICSKNTVKRKNIGKRKKCLRKNVS